jgi:hypothetical protein
MEDKSQPMLAVAISFAILTWLAVSLRIYVRCFMRKIFGIDDWLMMIAQVCILNSSGLQSLVRGDES